MAGKVLIIGVWIFVTAFWLLQFMPGVEDPFPLSPARRTATIYSDWQIVGHDPRTGVSIYEHRGTVQLELHVAHFIETKIGPSDETTLGWNKLTVDLVRVGIGSATSALVLGFVTLAWVRLRRRNASVTTSGK